MWVAHLDAYKSPGLSIIITLLLILIGSDSMPFLQRLLLLITLIIIAAPTTAMTALPGQLIVDPASPSWLVYNRDRNGDGNLDPAFICGPGDPEDFLYRGDRNPDGTRSGDQQNIIDNMITHGVNSIYLQSIRSHGGDGNSTHNPFIDSEPEKGLDGNILLQWDGWLKQLDDGGVVIYFFIYDDSARIWNGDEVTLAEQSYINAIVQRYQHLKHLVWVVAEEYSERYSPARISAIAREIKAADQHGHVIANHQHSSLEFDHAADPNLDQFALQYNVTTVPGMHEGMKKAWGFADGRYSLMMAESRDHGYDSRDQCRRKNWASAMGGAYVMILRMDGTVAYNDKMVDCKNLIQFFEATDFNTMAPHDELGNTGTWVLANKGTSYIAYRNTSGPLSVKHLPAGSYQARWLDTVTGTTVETTLILTNGMNTLPRPPAIGDEAAVWIRGKKRNVTVQNTTRSMTGVQLLLQEN